MFTKIIFQALLILIAINVVVSQSSSSVMGTNASVQPTNASSVQLHSWNSSLANVQSTVSASMQLQATSNASAMSVSSLGNVQSTAPSSVQLQSSSNAGGGSSNGQSATMSGSASVQLQPSSVAGGNSQSVASVAGGNSQSVASAAGGNSQSVASAATTNVQQTQSIQPTTAAGGGGQSSETTKQEATATKAVVTSSVINNPASSSAVPRKPIKCAHCYWNTTMAKKKQICNETSKECVSGQNRCTDYHISNKTKGVHGKGCATAKECENITKTCEDLKEKYNLNLKSECDILCCTEGQDCSKGYPVVQAGNSAIILLLALFVLLYSFV